MINAFGYYASAKGMVLVPDLSGLSSSAAIASLSANGLDYVIGSDIDTGTSSLDNLVAEQSPTANTLVDYSTFVTFRLYNFVASPPPPVDPPPVDPCVPNFGDDCFGPRGEVGQIGCSGNCVYTPRVDPPPPDPPPPPPAGCSGPPPFPDCFCAGSTWAC